MLRTKTKSWKEENHEGTVEQRDEPGIHRYLLPLFVTTSKGFSLTLLSFHFFLSVWVWVWVCSECT